MTPTGALREAVLGPHTAIGQLSTSARSATDPSGVVDVISAYLSVVSRHLAAVEATILPTARRQVADGRGRVAAYLRNARSLELAVRLLTARTRADVGGQSGRPEALWLEVDACMRAHVRLERDLVGELTRSLDRSGCAALSEDVHAAANHAPTRPHPLGPEAATVPY